MSKLPDNLDCPAEVVHLKIVNYISPIFYHCGITPNGITTISLLTGIYTPYCIFYNLNGRAAIFF